MSDAGGAIADPMMVGFDAAITKRRMLNMSMPEEGIEHDV